MRKYSNRQQKKKRYALSTLIAGVIFLMIVFGILLVFTANGKIRRVHADETSTISAQQTRMQSMLDQVVAQADHTPAGTALPEIQPTPTAIPETVASIVALDPADWKNWPILPQTISQKMIDIYRTGIEKGNNPAAFSKVGDSNSVMPSFLSCFDYGEKGYAIGSYTSLEETIQQFQWSFSRESRATKNGATALDLDGYHWYEDDICWPYESATTCEYRLWTPSIAFIALGTNDAFMRIDIFESHLRSLIQKTLDRFIVPILVTKADNLEGDDSFNSVIARLSIEYEVPCWNLWRAMDSLPNHGLREGDVHPTFNQTSLCNFSGSDLQNYGWTVRNLTALQALDRVWHLLNP
jgi:hypothetical protein